MGAKESLLPSDYEPRIHRAEVKASTRLGPGMIRVTLGGEDLHDYPTTGIGDEYVRLFFPDHPDEEPRLPFVTERGWDYPEGIEPSELRTYTIRKHRRGEIDVDFVVHEGGIAASWALQATPGQAVGINPPNPLYDRPADARRQLLYTDEPGLPAALRIAELTAHEVPTTIVAEVRAAENQLTADTEGVEYIWLRGTGHGHSPSQLVQALRREQLGEDVYVWLASETRVIREARKHLRHGMGLAAGQYKCIGYWIEKAEAWRARYEELGEEFRAKIDSLYESDRDTEDIVDEVQALYEKAGL